MNKYLKIGLILQVPNLAMLLTLFFIFVFMRINWLWFLSNFVWIFLGVVYLLINITSIIYLAVGFTNKVREPDNPTQY